MPIYSFEGEEADKLNETIRKNAKKAIDAGVFALPQEELDKWNKDKPETIAGKKTPTLELPLEEI